MTLKQEALQIFIWPQIKKIKEITILRFIKSVSAVVFDLFFRIRKYCYISIKYCLLSVFFCFVLVFIIELNELGWLPAARCKKLSSRACSSVSAAALNFAALIDLICWTTKTSHLSTLSNDLSVLDLLCLVNLQTRMATGGKTCYIFHVVLALKCSELRK